MSLYDSLRKALTPELFTQVTDALGDDFDYDVVPRARLNKVIKQRNELRDQLAGNTQTQRNANGSNEDGDDGEGLRGNNSASQVNIDELKAQWQKEQDAAVKAVRLQYAALEKLRAANVIDPELIWSSSVLDKSKIDLDDKGQVTGLDDMLTQLQKDKAHLFKKATDGVPGGTGKEGGDDDKGGGVTTREEFLKLPIDKQIAFKQANPEVFKTFMS
nr:MAG TPA: minor structural protein [Caudoviricetes sp.]